MQNYRFDIMGFTRSHWQFYQGFSIFLSANLALLTVLSWQLGNLSAVDPQRARPLVITLLAGGIVFAGLCWSYFFLAPAVVSSLIVVCLLGALIALQDAPPAA